MLMHTWNIRRPGIAALTLFLMAFVPLDDSGDSRIHFEKSAPAENGLSEIMARWRAEVLSNDSVKTDTQTWWPWGLAVFDFDGDGDLDLLVQHHSSARSMLMRNQLRETGTLKFTSANAELGLPNNALAGCFRPLVWDFDGDGFLDLAFCDAQRNTCYFNRGGKGFTEMGFGFPQLEGIHTIGDFNGDGYLDVRGDHAQFLYDSKKRRFNRAEYRNPCEASLPPSVADFIAAARTKAENRFLKARYLEDVDLDGDGIPDLACAGFSSYGGALFGRYLLGDRAGKFTDATESLGLPAEGTPILVQRFHDITAVLVVGSGLWIRRGNEKFQHQAGPLSDYLMKRAPYLDQVRVVDLNNDGDLDLVVWKPRGRSAAVFENRGGADFRLVLEAPTWDGDPVVVCDIDGDGLPDLCVGGPGDTVAVYLNRTKATGQFCHLFLRMDRPNPFAVGSRVEVFRPGELDKPNAQPLLAELAHPDGTAIHIGLSDSKIFDLRVTFPGAKKRMVEHRNVTAEPKIVVSPFELRVSREKHWGSPR